LLTAGELDLLVVDEAGQFSLASTMAASVAARRLLLLGDPQQLPQVSQATHADAVDESALGWLMQGHDTLPAELGYFLADTYRMHSELCSKVSALSYEGKLKVAADADVRELEGVAPGLGIVLVEHAGNRTESIEEARAVVEQIQALVGKRWRESQDVVARPLEGKDFLVVAPYNAQVACISEQLDAAGLSAVKVGTVDKFQGQEAPIAIVSMTASSHGDVPRGMAFLLNRNRVNVAVSRAKWRALVVRSPQLTAYMPGSPSDLLELGAFIGLCEVSH
jgi:superfamily I DNA and/or RNA helicase